ncbi:hypothetical protein [Streptomyces antnestii]|uniref:hypothetical protein n=1 Tax=Streptomyces antnestii TaxID=2494256 RepID=UPI001CB99546|nr:hypothetical protein [Streptomyces sp. San01]
MSPAVPVPGLVGRRHAVLELGDAVHLAADQDAAGQQRRLPPLDHLEPFAFQRASGQRGQLQTLAGR